jgi:hypothetical protein
LLLVARSLDAYPLAREEIDDLARTLRSQEISGGLLALRRPP